jgi:hypothetical protein
MSNRASLACGEGTAMPGGKAANRSTSAAEASTRWPAHQVAIALLDHVPVGSSGKCQTEPADRAARPQTKNLMISIATIRGPAANEKVNDFSSYSNLRNTGRINRNL